MATAPGRRPYGKQPPVRDAMSRHTPERSRRVAAAGAHHACDATVWRVARPGTERSDVKDVVRTA